MNQVSKSGRTYCSGKAIGEELRTNIIDSMIADGGDPIYSFFPGKFSDVAMRFSVTSQFVSKLWRTFCSTGEHLPKKRKSGNPSHLKDDDLELIEFLKKDRPSTSYQDIQETVENYCNIDGGTSVSAIGNAVRNNLSEGHQTWKRLMKPSSEKFTPANIHYAEQFIDTISRIPPQKLKFFDEAGVNRATGNPVYGHSLQGKPAIEIMPGDSRGANITLNLLCGLEGVLYVNTINGPSDSMEFLNFFAEAVKSTSLHGQPVIDFGDYIILDNCATHRYESGNTLQRWLMQMGVNLIFTPSRSPEFNAAEYVFNKLKIVLKSSRFRATIQQNVHIAVYEALDSISSDDMFGFFSKLL